MSDLSPGQPAALSSTGDATGAPDPAHAAQQAEKSFSQADVDRIVQERLARAQTQAEEAAEKVRQEAEAKALAEQGQYKQLAEQHATKLAALEPKAAQVERYEKALRAQLDQQRNGLPDHLTALLDRMDVAEQLEYLAANRSKLLPAAPAAAAAPLPAPNINGGAAAAVPAAPTATREEELRQRFRLGRR